VLVVLMRGHSMAIKGAMAAAVAGRVYRRLNDENYFEVKHNEPHTDLVAAKDRQ
jgi:hypothetical protein